MCFRLQYSGLITRDLVYMPHDCISAVTSSLFVGESMTWVGGGMDYLGRQSLPSMATLQSLFNMNMESLKINATEESRE